MRFLVVTCSLAMLTGACASEVGGPNGRSNTTGGTPTTPVDPTGMVTTPPPPTGDPTGMGGPILQPDTPAPFVCPSPANEALPARRLWRLSPDQLERSLGVALNGRPAAVQAPVQPAPGVSSPLSPVDNSTSGGLRYSTASGSLTVVAADFTRLVSTAGDVANAIVQSLNSSGCWGQQKAEPCLSQVINERGELLFRRPLTTEETAQYAKLATDNITGGAELGPDGALALALQGMMVAPQFIFRPEIGEAGPGGAKKLTQFEVATSLSYALTNAPPDVSLWDAASRGELATPEQVKSHIVRLMDSAGGIGARGFASEYFEVDRLLGVPKDADMASTGCAYQRARAVLAGNMLVDHLYDTSRTNGFFQTLLTSEAQFYDCSTEALLLLSGGPQTDGGALPVLGQAPQGQRAGLLTHPALMAALGDRSKTLPVRRGEFINEELLCLEVPAVPIEGIPPVEVDTSMMTERERLTTVHQGSNPTCKVCHALLDPPGLAFEIYDVVGAYRTTDKGQTIDATGTLVAVDDASVAFTDGADLSRKVAGTNRVTECIMRNAFRYFSGRKEYGFDSCTLQTAKEAYAPQGQGNYVDFVASMLTSDSFLIRNPN